MKLAFWKKEEKPPEDMGMPPEGMPGMEQPRMTDQMLETPMPGAEPTGIPSFEEPGMERPIESRMRAPGSPMPEPTFAEKPGLQPTPLETKPSYSVEKDLEIIAAKLDVLKAGIDNISQRLELLERERKARW
jgi:hypothetical protein